ncbi:TonB-dependent receptor [Porticoccus sp. GXU_MW_L64]
MKKVARNYLSASISAVLMGSALASVSAVAEEEKKVNVLEEIVVEARRREESLQDVPLSISAVSENTLKNRGVDDIKDISAFSPGLNIEGGVDNNTSRFFIRGVGTATPTFGNEQSVPLYIDDIYTPLGIGSNIDVFSVDRVEVLSGPQGTLYGRNSLGGAVKIYSKQFSDEAEGSVGITFGSFGQRNIKGEFMTPVIQDKLFFGAGYASIQNDGIQRNVFTNTRSWEDDKELYRIRLEARPSDQLTLKYSYEENTSEGAAKQLRRRPGTGPSVDSIFGEIGWEGFLQAVIDGYNAAATDLHALGLSGFSAADYPLLPDAPAQFTSIADAAAARGVDPNDVDNIFSDVTGDNTVETESHSWSVNFALNDNLNLKYLGSEFEIFNTRLLDIDGSVEAYFPGFEEFEYESSSHEFRLEYSSDRWDLSAGVYLYEEDHTAFQSFHNLFVGFGAVANIQAAVDAAEAAINAGETPDLSAIPNTPLAAVTDPLGQVSGLNILELRQNLRQNTESTAFYANFGFQATEKLRLSLGVRHTQDEKIGETPVGNNDGGPGIILPFSISPGTGNYAPVGGIQQFFDGDDNLSQFALDNFAAVNGDVPRTNVAPLNERFGNLGTINAEFDETTIEFTVDYSVNDDSLVYGSYKQGFQSGIIVPIDQGVTFTDGAGQTVTVNASPVTSPQQIDALELGFKTVINDRVRWNSAVYYYDWSDLILIQTLPTLPGEATFGTLGVPTSNATASSYGVETDIQWLVNDNLSIFANLGYNKFSLDSASNVNLATGEVTDTTADFVDEFPAATPELKFVLGGEYRHNLSSGGELRWWATASWRDDISTNSQSSFQNAGINLLTVAQFEESSDWISPSFTKLSAGVTYTNGDWRVDLSGDNLLDERRAEGAINARPGFFFGTLENYNKPLTWALSVSRDF